MTYLSDFIRIKSIRINSNKNCAYILNKIYGKISPVKNIIDKNNDIKYRYGCCLVAINRYLVSFFIL